MKLIKFKQVYQVQWPFRKRGALLFGENLENLQLMFQKRLRDRKKV